MLVLLICPKHSGISYIYYKLYPTSLYAVKPQLKNRLRRPLILLSNHLLITLPSLFSNDLAFTHLRSQTLDARETIISYHRQAKNGDRRRCEHKSHLVCVCVCVCV